ncbi:MAG: hypothetical protein RMJ00_07520 [Nitrososphaerota archaeon]|nr:hypothetical protein [Candidatus Bathyarchaeota archaeon]MDW8062527.1 hypothetical protein [Nitrososphaerota archaeon]
MGLRVRVRLEYKDRATELIVLANTGFEGDVPEILIPLAIAEYLKVWPNLPEDTLIETYRSASGLMRVYRVRGAKVRLIVDDHRLYPVEAYLVISEYTDEALINDQLISSLGIIIEDPAKGLWRLRGEEEIRIGEPPKIDYS